MTQWLWSSRPRVLWVKVSVTLACALRLKEKIVPIGGLLLLVCASLLASRQTDADWVSAVIEGAAAPVGGAWVAMVRIAPSRRDRASLGGAALLRGPAGRQLRDYAGRQS